MCNTAFQLKVDFQVITCCNCGVSFAVPARLQEELRNTHAIFYCPHGHGQHFTGKSAKEELQERLKREQEQLAGTRKRLEWERTANTHLQNSVRAHKGAKTRLKKRIAAGVCPCCNRHFENVQRHMDTKHKDYEGVRGG